MALLTAVRGVVFCLCVHFFKPQDLRLSSRSAQPLTPVVEVPLSQEPVVEEPWFLVEIFRAVLAAS